MFVWLFLYPLGSLPRAKIVLHLGVVEKNIITTQTMKGECWQILLKYCLDRRLHFLHELTLKPWSPPCFILSLDQSDVKSFVKLRLVTNFTRFFFHYFYVLRLSLILVAYLYLKLWTKFHFVEHWVNFSIYSLIIYCASCKRYAFLVIIHMYLELSSNDVMYSLLICYHINSEN